ncbi:MAG: hypothetical protein S4CHLAM7_10750 [Chlamydiae bacterium]|nr:hypothetical protein [Chlamydiota bacterium]
MHICQATAGDGELLKAVFYPEKGMNLISYSKGGIEAIDQQTRALFDERMAGLGALIGPHFHHRADCEIPPLKNDQLFPFIQGLKAKGEREFFSHGIGRYVPWKYKGSENQIEASLSGEDTYKGVKISSLEGQSFELIFKASFVEDQLEIDYSFTAERPGVIGLHYYYALSNQLGNVRAKVGPKYHRSEGWFPVEKSWLCQPGELEFKINSDIAADFGFLPFEKDATSNTIELHTESHNLRIHYQADSSQNSWQIYRPKGASYICLEPVLAQNPREAKLISGHLKVRIKIF